MQLASSLFVFCLGGHLKFVLKEKKLLLKNTENIFQRL